LLSFALGITSRSEKGTIFSKDLVPGWTQLGLYGLSLLFIFLGTFLLRVVDNTTPLTGTQWLICFGFFAGLILLEEVIKFFMRRYNSVKGA
jgi:hypothetical protein